MRRRGWTAAALALVSITVACGDDPADRPATGAPTSEVPASATTTTALDADGDLDADVGLSMLDLLEGRGQHGTFSVTAASGESVTGRHTYTGRYVRTSGGGTYTVADLDLPLVQAEVQRLLAMRERFDDLDPMFAEAFLSADTLVTDQLQLGLADLVMRTGFLGHAGALAVQPSLAFTAVEDNPLEPCQEALEALRSAVESRIAEAVPRLGRVWEPDAELLGGSEHEAVARACDGLDEVDTPGIGFEIADLTLSVLVNGEESMSIAVQPGDGEVLTVDAPSPAPLLDQFGLFFLAIDRCGELPWLYTSFDAASSYESPEEPSYIGPSPFLQEPVCADDVPG